MKSPTKPTYILGGMGPHASAALNKMILDHSKKFGARRGDQFPEFAIHSLPVREFFRDTDAESEAFELLARTVASIDPEIFGSFAIACNTAHLFGPQLSAIARVPLLSLVDRVVLSIANESPPRVHILASGTSIDSGLYQRMLSSTRTEYFVPDVFDQASIDRAIEAAIAGDDLESHRKALSEIGQRMESLHGPGLILLGCTELSLIRPEFEGMAKLDSLDVLAQEIVNNHFAPERRRGRPRPAPSMQKLV